MKRTITTEALAKELDRLAYILDPYEYWDMIGGRDPEHITQSVQRIAEDLEAGNAGYYVEWLREVIRDESTDYDDRTRARGRLSHLLDWLGK